MILCACLWLFLAGTHEFCALHLVSRDLPTKPFTLPLTLLVRFPRGMGACRLVVFYYMFCKRLAAGGCTARDKDRSADVLQQVGCPHWFLGDSMLVTLRSCACVCLVSGGGHPACGCVFDTDSCSRSPGLARMHLQKTHAIFLCSHVGNAHYCLA